MIYLFNDLNPYRNNETISEIVKKNKILDSNFKQFDYNENFMDFINFSLSKSFNRNEKKASIIFFNELDKNSSTWKIFLNNLENMNHVSNLCFVIVKYDLLNYFLPLKIEYFDYKELTFQERKNIIIDQLKKRKIKYDGETLFSFNKLSDDIFYLINELKRIEMLDNSDLSFFNKPFQDNTFTILENLINKNYLITQIELESFLNHYSSFILLDSIIKILSNILLYKNGLKNSKSVNLNLLKSYNFNYLTNKLSIEDFSKLFIKFLDLKNSLLNNKSSDVEFAIKNKLLLISFQI